MLSETYGHPQLPGLPGANYHLHRIDVVVDQRTGDVYFAHTIRDARSARPIFAQMTPSVPPELAHDRLKAYVDDFQERVEEAFHPF